MFWFKLPFCEYPRLSIPWEKLRKGFGKVKTQFLLKIAKTSVFLYIRLVFRLLSVFLYIRLVLRLLKKNHLRQKRFFTHPVFLASGKAAGKRPSYWASDAKAVVVSVCVLQPVSVVAPTAVVETGAQLPKDGESTLLPLCSHTRPSCSWWGEAHVLESLQVSLRLSEDILTYFLIDTNRY